MDLVIFISIFYRFSHVDINTVAMRVVKLKCNDGASQNMCYCIVKMVNKTVV